jgi:hypothetical protein
MDDSDTESIDEDYEDVSKNKSSSLLSSELSALAALNALLTELHNTKPTKHPQRTLNILSKNELLTFRTYLDDFRPN